jgi:glycosyltransferase involved in cell wall biosynthesis
MDFNIGKGTMSEVKVSVCIFAYNLERFIAKAIESVLMQKTDFLYEIIIGEDNSTDTTREICINYQRKNPGIISVLLREKNLGMKQNVFDTLKTASGKYVAVLDGDDYWIDPLKIQKQVDFLDSNPDFSLCCHNSIIIYEDLDLPPSLFNPKNQKDVIPVEDLIMNWSMATASMLFRNSMMSFPDWVYEAHNFDVAIQMILADRGKVKYLKDPMSVYRRTADSNSFNPNYPPHFVLNKHIELLEKINEYYEGKYNDVILKRISGFKKSVRQMIIYKKYPFIKYLNPSIYYNKILLLSKK